MRRATFDEASQPDRAGPAPEPRGPELLCSVCRHPASREHLVTFGARCFPCFKAYQREAQPRWTPTIRRDDVSPAAWCLYRMATIEAAGGSELSPARAAMAKSCRRVLSERDAAALDKAAPGWREKLGLPAETFA